jgi:hypothetical protein
MKKPQGILPCGLSFRGNFGSSRAGRVHPNNGESFLANANMILQIFAD